MADADGRHRQYCSANAGDQPGRGVSPVGLKRNAQVELPALVGPQQVQELVPGHKSTINDNTLRVESAADAFERHLDRRPVLDEEPLAESLANLAA